MNLDLESVKTLWLVISTIFGLITIVTGFFLNESFALINNKVGIGVGKFTKSDVVLKVVYSIIDYIIGSVVVGAFWTINRDVEKISDFFKFNWYWVELSVIFLLTILYKIKIKSADKDIDKYLKNYYCRVSKTKKFISKRAFEIAFIINVMIAGLGLWCVLKDNWENLIFHIVCMIVSYILTIGWYGREKALQRLMNLEEVELCYMSTTQIEKVKIICQDKESLCFMRCIDNNVEIKIISKSSINYIRKVYLCCS